MLPEYKYDHNDALLTIHSGAGGTESQGGNASKNVFSLGERIIIVLIL